MPFNKLFFVKVFSDNRMERYFNLYPNNEILAITHYGCNLQLSEALYIPLSVFEVTLRNALCRELKKMTRRDDWYVVFQTTPQHSNLNRYISQAAKQISGRHEQVTPSKIVAELTFGFWVSLLNSEYERILLKDLRRAFPYIPKTQRQRKFISAPLNRFRALRNRVFHNESICWNLNHVISLHNELTTVLSWMNKDVPTWLLSYDRFPKVVDEISITMNWK